MDINYLATLRCLVGKLGEKESNSWWESDFFSTPSVSFISPIFPRTGLLAQCQGASAAAALVHEERIGVGAVFHLFRLPEDLELEIHKCLQNEDFVTECRQHIATAEAARSALVDILDGQKVSEGPVVAGSLKDIHAEKSWKGVAELYAKGFDNGKKVFPYFASTAG